MKDFGGKEENDTLTILIPAFDRPNLLLRAIESIIEQDYRPLNIIISFDKSETDMSEVENLCLVSKSVDLNFEFYYQENNLGAYQNLHFLWSSFKGRYFVYMPHDDFLIKNDFFSQAMQIFKEQEDCGLVIGNSGVEPDTSGFGRIMINIFSLERQWEIFDGDYFFENRLFADLHPAYSAVIIDSLPLRCMNYSESWVPVEKYKSMNIEPDEGFVALIMSSAGKKVAVSSEIVSVRGNPEDSWSKSDFWQKKGFHGLLIQYANLHCLAKKLKQTKVAAKALQLCGTAIIVSPPPFFVGIQALKLGVPRKFFIMAWGFGLYKKWAQIVQKSCSRIGKIFI